MPERYELVCRSAHGTVQQCRCCAAMRVRFGKLLLRLDQPGFRQFGNAIATARGCPSQWSAAGDGGLETALPPLSPPAGAIGADEEFIFYLGESPLGFVLTRTELDELDDLLQRASRVVALLAWPDAPEPSSPRARRLSRRGGRHA